MGVVSSTARTGTAGVVSSTVGQALRVLLAGPSGTGAVGVISCTAGQALWVLLAGQRGRHCGCY